MLDEVAPPPEVEPAPALPLGAELVEPLALVEPPDGDSSFFVASADEEALLDEEGELGVEPEAALDEDGLLGVVAEPETAPDADPDGAVEVEPEGVVVEPAEDEELEPG